jgi:lysozyme
MSMTLGKRGEALIKSKETLRLKAYLPTPHDVPTLGWGHTRNVTIGMTCTAEQAERWFQEDVAGAVRIIGFLGFELSQSMFDALVSLVYNAGPAPLATTATIGAALRKRDWFGAWRGFALWTKQGSKDLRGLAERRAQEMALFMEDPLPD